MIEALLATVPVLLAILAALLIGRWLWRSRPGLGRGAVAILAAVPLPLISTATGVITFARINPDLPAEGCGMPLIGPMLLIMYGIIGYIVAVPACLLCLRGPVRS